MSTEHGRRADRAVPELRATFAEIGYRYLLLRLISDARLSIAEAQTVVLQILTSDAERARIEGALNAALILSAAEVLKVLCSARVGAEEIRRLLPYLDRPAATPKDSLHAADGGIALCFAAAQVAASPELRYRMTASGVTPLTTEQREVVRTQGLSAAGLPQDVARGIAESAANLLTIAPRSARMAALPDASSRLATARRARTVVEFLTDAAHRLADPDLPPEEVAKAYELVSRQWVLLHGGDARGKGEPMGFRQAIAMRLIEAVAMAAVWRVREAADLEAATERAWWQFHEDAPDLSHKFAPSDLADAIALWPGQAGGAAKSPFKPLAGLVERIGWTVTWESLGKLWRDFARSTHFEKRARTDPES